MNANAQYATYTQIGSFLETILEGERNLQPKISEYQFEREVLGLLENPFGQDFLTHYSHYVGELTKPLHVVSNTNRDEILFTVPALVQSPIPTTASGPHGITADVFFYHLLRDMELGGRHVNEKIQRFMSSITRTPNYLQTVIYPIQEILGRYNRRMIDLPGVSPTHTDSPVSSTGQSGFSDDYED